MQFLNLVCLCIVNVSTGVFPVSEQRHYPNDERGLLGERSDRTATVQIADIDGDGRREVIVGNGRHWRERNEIFGYAEGAFRRLGFFGPDEGETTYAVPLADFDGDGDLDIAVGNDRVLSGIYANDGRGGFLFAAALVHNARRTFNTRSLTVHDLDGDGDVDVLMTNRGEANRIFFNDGEGGFGRSRPFGEATDSTIQVVVGDVDGDGHIDLVLANRDGQQNYVYLGDGSGDFKERRPFGTGKDETRAVGVADFDLDGHLDIAVGNIGEPNFVYLNDGTGHFEDRLGLGTTQEATYCLTVVDMNLDELPDVVVGNVAAPNAVYFNVDGEGFEGVPFGKARDTYGVAVGDLNGDDYPDIAVANSEGPNVVYWSRERGKEH